MSQLGDDPSDDLDDLVSRVAAFVDEQLPVIALNSVGVANSELARAVAGLTWMTSVFEGCRPLQYHAIRFVLGPAIGP